MGYGGMICIIFLLIRNLCHETARATAAQETNADLALARFKDSVTDRKGSLLGWESIDFSDTCTGHSDMQTVADGVSCSGNGTQMMVDLHGSYLIGSTESISILAEIEFLVRLDLSDNYFYGQLPRTLANLTELSYLSLQNNYFSGRILSLPGSLYSLKLQNNNFAGELTALNNQSRLAVLDVHGNRFTGRLPVVVAPLWNFSVIRYLDLSDNQLEGPIPSPAGLAVESPNTKFWNLSLNNFSGQIPSGFSNTGFVDLSKNQLSGSIPSDMFDKSGPVVVSMYYRNLSSNLLTGSIPWKNDTGALPYSVLDLSQNRLENSIPEQMVLSVQSTIEILNLQSNRLSGDIDISILAGNFSKLKELRLSENKFTAGVGLKQISGRNFPVLEVLDLFGNRLQGEIPTGLHQMPTLRKLHLQRNCMSGEIRATRNSTWRNLEVLDLSDNLFSWGSDTSTTLQLMFETYSSMRELNLAGNNFSTGVLPLSSGGRSEKLEILNLSNSNLEGTISPGVFNNLHFPSLKYLDLSNNRLRGNLPSTFGNMPNLIYLNVSNNQLSGQLPAIHLPKRLMNPDFFDGNPGLCGYPLPTCPDHSGGVHLKVWQVLLVLFIPGILSWFLCLFLGWRWRRNVDSERQKQDGELIRTLLDRDATLMSLRDLKKATGNFADRFKIGQGGFGTVYVGKMESGKLVAIKKSNRDGSSADKRRFLNEVRILAQVHHRNLVRLLGCCLADKTALLVFEYISNGTLKQHLNRTRGDAPLSWKQRLHIALQTADAVDYLHSSANPPIYHLDVKSANILLDSKLNAKVADFGISKLAPAPEATHITAWGEIEGTMGYMDPESVMSSKFSGKSDVYSFGIVLLELITAKPAVDRSEGEGMEANLAMRVTDAYHAGQLEDLIDPSISETFQAPEGKQSIMGVIHLAMGCIQLESRHRPTMTEVSSELQTIWSWHYEHGSADGDGASPSSRSDSVSIESIVSIDETDSESNVLVAPDVFTENPITATCSNGGRIDMNEPQNGR